MQFAFVNFAQDEKRHIQEQKGLWDNHGLQFVALENVEFRLKSEDVVCTFCPDGGKDALDVLKRVRDATKFRESALVVVTQRGDTSFETQCRAAGASLILTYPFTQDAVQDLERLGTRARGEQTVLNATFINCVIRALAHVMESMVRIKRLSRKRTFVRSNRKVLGDVSAQMCMKADSGLTASISLGFDEHFAAMMVARMTGQSVDALSKADIYDGVGELLNIICGSARSGLAEAGYKFQGSVPTVIRGASGAQPAAVAGANLALIFEADAAEFCLQFVLGHS